MVTPITPETPTEQLAEAQAAAQAATTPSTFNFAEAILDRSYPEFEVPIYLDEKKVQRMLDLDEEINELDNQFASRKASAEDSARYQSLVTERDEIKDSLRDSKFVVKMRGISPEQAMKIEEASYEKFPKEYTDSVNAITGQPIKVLVENEDRDEFVSMTYRQAHLISVTSPTGAVDDDFSDLEKIRVMFARLPYVARVKIDNVVQKATIAVDFYREIADEVF